MTRSIVRMIHFSPGVLQYCILIAYENLYHTSVNKTYKVDLPYEGIFHKYSNEVSTFLRLYRRTYAKVLRLAVLAIFYLDSIKYSDLVFFSEHENLFRHHWREFLLLSITPLPFFLSLSLNVLFIFQRTTKKHHNQGFPGREYFSLIFTKINR